MEKLNRLVWTDSFVISPYGVPTGFRTNRPNSLKPLLDWVERWGWRPTAEPCQEVLYLYSYRSPTVGKIRGKRDYHLLYFNEVLIGRALDWDLLISSAESDLVDRVESSCSVHFVLQGGVVSLAGELWLVLGQANSGGESGLEARLEVQGRVILDASGYVYNSQVRQRLTGLVLTEVSSGLSRAQFCAELLGYSLSSLEHTSGLLEDVAARLYPCTSLDGCWRWKPLDH